MNDFTETELKYLLWSIKFTKSKTSNCSDPLSLLKEKIIKLIDDYCDHVETYEDMDYNPIRCKKCLEIVE